MLTQAKQQGVIKKNHLIIPSFSRRHFLKGLICSACAPYSLSAPIKLELEKVKLYSAATDHKGDHWLVIANAKGETLNQLRLPSRAHQVFKHPSLPLLCVVARRPGKYLSLVHLNTGTLIKTISPSKGYHFYGHGLFTHDGRYLVTSENHIESGEGRITIRDRLSEFSIVYQYDSQGIGPHEIKLSTDGLVLVVANGGIKTHPDKGREKLNLNTMRPSLVYLELLTGKLLEKVSLPKQLHQLSIRHIDINHHDQVVIAMQYQGDITDQVALMGTHNRGEDIRLLNAPINSYLAMKHYCGSVCFDFSGMYAAATSPKGNRVTIWDTVKGNIIDELRCRDACGVAALGKQGFMVSSGAGKLYHYNIEHKEIKQLLPQSLLTNSSQMEPQIYTQIHSKRMAWDNHLSISI